MQEHDYAPDLQLFADGGAAGGEGTAAGAPGVNAPAAGVQTGGKSASLSAVKYGIQSESEAPAAEVQQPATPTAEERSAAFDALIRGEYKDLYDAKVQNIVQQRLKSSKDTVERYNALSPTLEMLGRKYGVDPNDTKALNKAIEDDDAFYEQEAAEKGVTVQQLKDIRRMERENAALREEMRQREGQDAAARQYAAWMDQSRALTDVYPSFRLDTEVENPQFRALLRSGIDVRTAYEVIHKDEIIPAAMQFTAKTVEEKLAKKYAANANRPSEGGTAGQGAATVKADVSKLTRADREEIDRRVARGEIIRF